MLKQIAALTLLASLAAPASAQTSAAPAGGPPPPDVAPAGVIPPTPGGPIGYLSDVPPGLFSAERLKGVEVIGLDINRVGEIEDVLVDRTGRIAAVVIGVGGFLGIGTKSVAVPFEALLLNFEGSATDGPSSSTTGAGLQVQAARNNDPTSPGVNTTGAAAAPGVSAGARGPNAEAAGTGGRAVAGGPGPLTPMARGSGDQTENRTGMEAAMGGAPAVGSATVPMVAGELKRVVLRATKADLERAPAFRRPR